MIELQPFRKQDFDQLIGAIPDARFLLQWAGPEYTFPLTASQLYETLTKYIGEKPESRIFKAVIADIAETVGHIQLLNIDQQKSRCTLGRIIVFENYRGKGLGQKIVKLAVREAFEILDLHEVLLNVFDFNLPAIQTYEKIGFTEVQIQEDARRFQNEHWDLVKMVLTRDKWSHN